MADEQGRRCRSPSSAAVSPAEVGGSLSVSGAGTVPFHPRGMPHYYFPGRTQIAPQAPVPACSFSDRLKHVITAYLFQELPRLHELSGGRALPTLRMTAREEDASVRPRTGSQHSGANSNALRSLPAGCRKRAPNCGCPVPIRAAGRPGSLAIEHATTYRYVLFVPPSGTPACLPPCAFAATVWTDSTSMSRAAQDASMHVFASCEISYHDKCVPVGSIVPLQKWSGPCQNGRWDSPAQRECGAVRRQRTCG